MIGELGASTGDMEQLDGWVEAANRIDERLHGGCLSALRRPGNREGAHRFEADRREILIGQAQNGQASHNRREFCLEVRRRQRSDFGSDVRAGGVEPLGQPFQ